MDYESRIKDLEVVTEFMQQRIYMLEQSNLSLSEDIVRLAAASSLHIQNFHSQVSLFDKS